MKTNEKSSIFSLNDTVLESNKHPEINFNGGDLSSDSGLILLKEFISRLGFEKCIEHFKTNDSAAFRFHADSQNLRQVIFQIFGISDDEIVENLMPDSHYQYTLHTTSSLPSAWSNIVNHIFPKGVITFINFSHC